MPRRKTTHRRRKKYSIGDFDKRIKLHKRVIQPPLFDVAAPTESYDTGTQIWASVNTFDLVASGEQIFDKVDLSESPSHKFVIRWREFLNDGKTKITSEVIIRWDENFYKILKIINPEGRNEYFELFAILLGAETKEVNK
jgi:hypothetical protein